MPCIRIDSSTRISVMRTPLALLAATILAMSCFVHAEPVSAQPATTQPAAAVAEPVADVNLLADWLTGHFSSVEQSKTNPEYFEIHLHASRIWTDRTDGPWIYVEQAMGSALDKPYRQRIYHIALGADGLFESAVYELPDPAVAVGAWKDAGKLKDVTPQNIKSRQGCTVYLKFINGNFNGGTRGDECLSSLRGAHHASSEVLAGPNGLRTWDRGFDASGKQVWGATAGPYVFDRMKD